jgi:hypothetical protein
VQQRPGPLPLQPLSIRVRQRAAAAVQAVTQTLPGPIRNLVNDRVRVRNPLPTLERNPNLVQLVSRDMALNLIAHYCAGFRRLMALQEASTPLQDRMFAHCQGPMPQSWAQDVLAELPEAQLLNAAGIKAGVSKVDVGRLLTAQRNGVNLSDQLRGIQDVKFICGSMRSFFWRAQALLTAQIADGVVVPGTSKAYAGAVVQAYVQGMAHVGRILIRIHNLLLAQAPAGGPEAGQGVVPAAAAGAAAGAGGPVAGAGLGGVLPGAQPATAAGGPASQPAGAPAFGSGGNAGVDGAGSSAAAAALHGQHTGTTAAAAAAVGGPAGAGAAAATAADPAATAAAAPGSPQRHPSEIISQPLSAAAQAEADQALDAAVQAASAAAAARAAGGLPTQKVQRECSYADWPIVAEAEVVQLLVVLPSSRGPVGTVVPHITSIRRPGGSTRPGS